MADILVLTLVSSQIHQLITNVLKAICSDHQAYKWGTSKQNSEAQHVLAMMKGESTVQDTFIHHLLHLCAAWLPEISGHVELSINSQVAKCKASSYPHFGRLLPKEIHL